MRESLTDMARIMGANRVLLRCGARHQLYSWPDAPIAARDSWIDRIVWPIDDQEGRQVVWLNRAESRNHPAFADDHTAAWLCLARSGKQEAVKVFCLGFDRAEQGRVRPDRAEVEAKAEALLVATGRAVAESDMRRLDLQVADARRFETIGALTSGMAHNFNNLLGAIAGHAEMALGLHPSLQIAQHLEQIELSVKRGRELVAGLLTYGRPVSRRRTHFQIRAMVRETCALAQAAIGVDPKLELLEDVADAVVAADLAQLQQALLNILRNAAEASPPNLNVLVSIAPVVGERDTSLIEIAVTDRGDGISREARKHLFEPFHTTRSNGTGLGLFTARDIIEREGGSLALVDGPERGTTVRVRLPCIEGLPPELASQSAMPKTLLVFAETLELRYRAEDTLAAVGLEPLGFVDSSAAIAQIDAIVGDLDGILIIGTPDEQKGAHLFHAAQARKPGMPRLLCCPSAELKTGATLLALGVTDVVEWPLNPWEVVEVIDIAPTP